MPSYEYLEALRNVKFKVYGTRDQGVEFVAKQFGRSLDQVYEDMKTVDGKQRGDE